MGALLCIVAGWAQETVTVPESATVVDYTLSYTDIDYYDNQTPCTEQRQVAFDGNDIYLSGLGFSADIWVKGTLDGNKLTIPQRQLAGKANNKNYYLVGHTSEGGSFQDIVFTYIESSGVFYCEHEIVAVDANDYVGGRMMDVIYTPGQTAVEGIPEDAVFYKYMLNYTDLGDNKNYTENRRVAFHENDIWIEDLAFQGAGVWSHGTISGALATFTKGQSAGTYTGIGEIFLYGMDDNGDSQDIIFDYDAESGMLSTLQYILLKTSDGTRVGAMCDVIFLRDSETSPETDETVTPPANINPQSYVFKGKSIIYDQDGVYQGTEDNQWNIKVAWSGSNEIYVQGLCSAVPEAWVKGTMDDGEVTFAKGQYFGKQVYPFYFAGQIFGELSDFVMTFDSSTRTFNGGSYYLMINSSKTAIAPYEVYTAVTFTPGEAAATPMAPQVGLFLQHDDEYFGGNGSVEFILLPYDAKGHPLSTDKLGFEILKKKGEQEEILVFTKADYPYIPQDNMTVIPYGFTDNWSFMLYNFDSYIGYLLELMNVNYPTIGVRAVYTGGGEENRSETTWLDCDDWTEPIEDPTAINTQTLAPITVSYTDAMGRTVTADAKGLVIKTVTFADGSKHSTKLIRR